MGCCCSCTRTSNTEEYNIRVVDINGDVQDFDYPIIVKQLTGSSKQRTRSNSVIFNNRSCFVSTAEKLLSPTGSKQLGPETQLHPGQVYFLLPFSLLKEPLSPMDYVSLVKRLKSVAKSAPKNAGNYGDGDDVIISGGGVDSSLKRSRRVNYRRNKRTWKLILSTIREVSFNRRSESELLRDMEDSIRDL